MKKLSVICFIFVLGLFLARCGEGRDGGIGQFIENAAVMTSSTLNTFSSSSSEPGVQVTATCASANTRCTPENLSGDICYAIYGMGELGEGFFSGLWLWPEDMTDPEEELQSGACSATTFDLSASTTFNGSVNIPESESEMPSNKQIIRMELSFNYLDAKISINNGALDNTFVVRTVYVDDPDAAWEQGDKLYRLSSETEADFKWCNSTTCSTTRSDVATGIIQDATVTEYEHNGDGNESYIPVTANFGENGVDAYDVTFAQLADTTLTWTLDFDVSDAILWSEAPSTFTNVREMLTAFRLKFGPNQSTTQGEEDDGIHASLTIE